ncbi:cytochrome P450 2A13 [Parasteatoda tepidariorum]|uniref:cytochrome P450 2A13 n=1 Tax=Parasteatoda tepidariorum TaxID=114398 RepID=UPI00077FAC71|nr:cytochrome P450 2A13 [Parasteatoda tepidariorum]
MVLSEDFSSIILALIFLIFTLILVNFWKNNRNLPPGPIGLPVFGYYPFLTPKPYLDFADLAKKYGDLFSFRTVGGKLFVVLNGHKTIKSILVNRADEFIGRPIESNLLEWISDGMGITQEEGSPWKEHRRFFLHSAKAFGFGNIEIEETIQEEVRTVIEAIKETKGESADFDLHVAYAVNSTIALIMFGKKFEKESDLFPKLSKGVRDLIAIFADHRFMLVGPFFQHFAMKYLPWSKEVRAGRRLLKDTVTSVIDEHVRTFDPNYQRDYVDAYLSQMEKLKDSGELKNSTFTIPRLISISMNMIMEGTETVTTAIMCLLVEASKHLEEQMLVQKELDAVVGKERLPSWLDRQNLPYFQAFLQELYRVNLPFSITTHYCNFKETTINGYRIPERSIFVANLWTINNDPELYPEPKKFNVQRFLDTDGKRIKTEGPYPFSLGKRDCVGQSLGQMEVFLIVSSILQRFTLYPGAEYGLIRAILRD